MRQTLIRTVAPCLLLAACAGGTASTTSFAPAPPSGLRSGGYVAPEIGAPQRAPQAAARTASQMQAAPSGLRGPVRIAEAKPSPVATDAAPQVPAAPPQDWSAPPRAPLPDLDEIVVRREEPPAPAPASAPTPAPAPRTQLAAVPPTRSVLPEARRAAPAAPAAAPAPASQANPARGGYALHLASYRYAEQAEAGWAVLTREHPGVLDGLAPARAAVDLPEQGRFHRLLAGPLPAGAAAESCAALEAAGGYCAVVPWSGTRL